MPSLRGPNAIKLFRLVAAATYPSALHTRIGGLARRPENREGRSGWEGGDDQRGRRGKGGREVQGILAFPSHKNLVLYCPKIVDGRVCFVMKVENDMHFAAGEFGLGGKMLVIVLKIF